MGEERQRTRTRKAIQEGKECLMLSKVKDQDFKTHSVLFISAVEIVCAVKLWSEVVKKNLITSLTVASFCRNVLSFMQLIELSITGRSYVLENSSVFCNDVMIFVSLLISLLNMYSVVYNRQIICQESSI